MRFKIEKDIFSQFPDFIAGVVIAKDINNRGNNPEIQGLLHGIGEKLQNEFLKLSSPSQRPNIVAWRQAYKKFGTDPHQYRCSSEALARQILKGNDVGHINKLVDIYNYISLKYITPVGGEDIDALVGDLLLGFAKGDEKFIRLGGTENELPLPGEVVYKDDVGVICRRWNWREGDRTKLTEKTHNAVIVIDALPPVNKLQVEEATKELTTLVQKYCGGNVSYKILNTNMSEIVSEL